MWRKEPIVGSLCRGTVWCHCSSYGFLVDGNGTPLHDGVFRVHVVTLEWRVGGKVVRKGGLYMQYAPVFFNRGETWTQRSGCIFFALSLQADASERCRVACHQLWHLYRRMVRQTQYAFLAATPRRVVRVPWTSASPAWCRADYMQGIAIIAQQNETADICEGWYFGDISAMSASYWSCTSALYYQEQLQEAESKSAATQELLARILFINYSYLKGYSWGQKDKRKKWELR